MTVRKVRAAELTRKHVLFPGPRARVILTLLMPNHLLMVGDYLLIGEPWARRYHCVTKVLDSNHVEVRPAGRFEVMRFRVALRVGLWFKRCKRWRS